MGSTDQATGFCSGERSAPALRLQNFLGYAPHSVFTQHNERIHQPQFDCDASVSRLGCLFEFCSTYCRGRPVQPSFDVSWARTVLQRFSRVHELLALGDHSLRRWMRWRPSSGLLEDDEIILNRYKIRNRIPRSEGKAPTRHASLQDILYVLAQTSLIQSC